MIKVRSTKNALILSVISLVMCCVLLLGSTFAWFTDSVSTGVNKIMAGNLDVKMEYAVLDDTGAFTEWKDANGADSLFTDGLWEPGHAEVVYLKISNAGSLALKYNFKMDINETQAVNVNGESFSLSSYIKYGTVEKNAEAEVFANRGDAIGAVSDSAVPITDYTQTDVMLEAKQQKYLAMVVYMPDDVGNEANYDSLKSAAPTIDLGITLTAAQAQKEADSFSDDYDSGATYPITDASGFKSITGKSGVYTLGSDIKLTGDTSADTHDFYRTTTLDLNNKTIDLDSGMGNTNFYAIGVLNEGVVTINGKGTVKATAQTGAYCVNVFGAFYSKGGTVIINDGTYMGTPTAVQVEKGKAIINGGFFDCAPSDNTGDYRYTLNCIDAAYKNGQASITVMGGTFVNFNPADNLAEGEGTNFVAEGYKVISEQQADGDIWYTVVPE